MAASGGNETIKITPRLVVAIDIGTYASGYAFQFRNDFEDRRLQIYANKNWYSRYQSFATYKTPTCLLLKPDKTFSDFGFEASQKYYRFKTKGAMTKTSDCSNHYYFRHFKMALYHKETITDETPIEAADEKHLPAIIVFSKTIEYFKSHMIKHLNTSGLLKAKTFKSSIKTDKAQEDTSSMYDPDETRWVITVPALWGEPAKQLMKRAAIQAGLSAERVIIALEPECAAIYCSQLPDNQLEIYGDKDDIKYVASPGSNIMVVDIGGGTVDISTLTVCNDSKMKQIHKSGGGIWGGQRINDKILEMLVDIFGQEVMTEFSEHHGSDENNLRIGIEREKRELKDSTNNEDADDIGFQIDFSDSLRRICEDKHPKREINAILTGKPVTFEAGQLIFQSDKIRQYFQETSSCIIKYLKEVLNDPLLHDIKIDTMLVVGGFAESNTLIECLRTGLVDMEIPVVRPLESELAVLKGAVLFGHDETLIVSRVMTHTIGIAMTMDFDPEKHDEKEAYFRNGKKFANNVFRKHVVIGQSVRIDEWIESKEYYPEDLNQSQTTIYVFSSDRKSPVHTTEVGCKYIGHFNIIFKKNENVRKIQKCQPIIKVDFYFGGTEWKVRAVSTVDGETKTEYLSIL